MFTYTDISHFLAFLFKKFFIILAVMGLCCCMRASLVAAREPGDLSLLQCAGFSLWWLLLLPSTGSRSPGSVVESFWALEGAASVIVIHGLSFSIIVQSVRCV